MKSLHKIAIASLAVILLGTYFLTNPKENNMFFKKLNRQEAIEQHIERNIGKIYKVFHEIVSPDIHVDIYWIKTESYGKKINVLVTSGMSEKPMNTPASFKQFQYSELMIILPDDWKLDDTSLKNENNYWPLRLLKVLARYPHENNTWLGFEHTLDNENPPEKYAENVGFTGVLLYAPLSLDISTTIMKYNKYSIRFYCIIPLYPEEMNYALKNGTDSLTDKFEQYKVTDIVDINRVNTCK